MMRHAAGLPSQASTADKAADASPDLDLTPLVDSEPAFSPGRHADVQPSSSQDEPSDSPQSCIDKQGILSSEQNTTA